MASSGADVEVTSSRSIAEEFTPPAGSEQMHRVHVEQPIRVEVGHPTPQSSVKGRLRPPWPGLRRASEVRRALRAELEPEKARREVRWELPRIAVVSEAYTGRTFLGHG